MDRRNRKNLCSASTGKAVDWPGEAIFRARVRIVQFHPAFGYEDFIEGIRPERIELENGLSSVDYPTRAGIFRSFCEQAAKDKGQKYVFIIDEINRGNIPRIFGELMLLLEYREEKVTLPYSGEEFSIPKNVYLIGTMNTADRSIALVDFALRRRFHFFQFKADPDLFARWLDRNPNEITYLKELYAELTAHAIDDPNFQIGHSYFMDAEMTKEKLARIWRYSIEPSLEEYYMGQQQKADLWRWDGERVKRIRLGNETAKQS
ncbi:MAG: AAA family ATPase [Chloroflexi bacterium]|nr:AAA family ATPase [Chloroflexota bacterium]